MISYPNSYLAKCCGYSTILSFLENPIPTQPVVRASTAKNTLETSPRTIHLALYRQPLPSVSQPVLQEPVHPSTYINSVTCNYNFTRKIMFNLVILCCHLLLQKSIMIASNQKQSTVMLLLTNRKN